MLIDWFTVAAQALNFFILVWLLKRFLYQPILDAIDAREQRIADELADAAEKQTQAQSERDDFEHKNQVFDQQRDEMMEQAVDAANKEQQDLIAKVQKSTEALRLKHQQNLLTEAHNFKKKLSRKVSEEVFAIIRKTLNDLASMSLEAKVVEAFKRRLTNLDKSQKALLAKALNTLPNAEPVMLRSAFKLSVTQREAIKTALEHTFDIAIALKFETREDLICGIEVSANGQKIVWNIADYLQSFEQVVDDLLHEKIQHTTKIKSDSKSQTEQS